MLARIALLALLIPTLALAASGGPITVPPPKTPVATPVAATPAPTPAPVTPVADVDPSDCRIGCAQTRYFCAASDRTDGCGEAWGQCVATCDLPHLDTGVSTAP